VYYYYYSAPYFLLFAGLLASLASGVAFEATLKLAVRDWSKNQSTRTLANLRGPQLQLPFLGMCGGVCFFLTSGLQIFGFPGWLGYSIAVPLTLLIGGLIWYQLGRVLRQIEQGGSKALDLDSFT
jgi:hypothetical protein